MNSIMYRQMYSMRRFIFESLNKPRVQTRSRVAAAADVILEIDGLKISVEDMHGSRGVVFTKNDLEVRMMEKTFRGLINCHGEIIIGFDWLNRQIRKEASLLLKYIKET